MFEFADVIRLLNRLKADGVVADYAIAGAMAAAFWDEATATQDLDVAVILPDASSLDPLRPIFVRLPEHEFARQGEHILIAGVPVQFLPACSPGSCPNPRHERLDTTHVRRQSCLAPRPTAFVAAREGRARHQPAATGTGTQRCATRGRTS